MKRTILIITLLLIFSFAQGVLAEGSHEEEIEEGRLIVEAKTSCDTLSEDDLEVVGEYYMELMHPGALHDAMHEMMGLVEGTQEHKQFHISLAQRMYCGEGTNGMMGNNYGMMGYGMMSMMYGSTSWNSFWSIWNLAYIVFIAVIFAVVFWAVYLLIKKEKRRERK